MKPNPYTNPKCSPTLTFTLALAVIQILILTQTLTLNYNPQNQIIENSSCPDEW